jgi:hypothetical protein
MWCVSMCGVCVWCVRVYMWCVRMCGVWRVWCVCVVCACVWCVRVCVVCVRVGVNITTLAATSNGRMTDELEMIWKETVVA